MEHCNLSDLPSSWFRLFVSCDSLQSLQPELGRLISTSKTVAKPLVACLRSINLHLDVTRVPPVIGCASIHDQRVLRQLSLDDWIPPEDGFDKQSSRSAESEEASEAASGRVDAASINRVDLATAMHLLNKDDSFYVAAFLVRQHYQQCQLPQASDDDEASTDTDQACCTDDPAAAAENIEPRAPAMTNLAILEQLLQITALNSVMVHISVKYSRQLPSTLSIPSSLFPYITGLTIDTSAPHHPPTSTDLWKLGVDRMPYLQKLTTPKGIACQPLTPFQRALLEKTHCQFGVVAQLRSMHMISRNIRSVMVRPCGGLSNNCCFQVHEIGSSGLVQLKNKPGLITIVNMHQQDIDQRIATQLSMLPGLSGFKTSADVCFDAVPVLKHFKSIEARTLQEIFVEGQMPNLACDLERMQLRRVHASQLEVLNEQASIQSLTVTEQLTVCLGEPFALPFHVPFDAALYQNVSLQPTSETRHFSIQGFLSREYLQLLLEKVVVKRTVLTVGIPSTRYSIHRSTLEALAAVTFPECIAALDVVGVRAVDVLPPGPDDHQDWDIIEHTIFADDAEVVDAQGVLGLHRDIAARLQDITNNFTRQKGAGSVRLSPRLQALVHELMDGEVQPQQP